MARITVFKTGQAEASQPAIGLDQRLITISPVEDQAKRDVLARRLPRQQRVILKQDADFRTLQPGIDRAGQRLLQSHDDAQQAGLS